MRLSKSRRREAEQLKEEMALARAAAATKETELKMRQMRRKGLHASKETELETLLKCKAEAEQRAQQAACQTKLLQEGIVSAIKDQRSSDKSRVPALIQIPSKANCAER